jgi:hypothetical protein
MASRITTYLKNHYSKKNSKKISIVQDIVHYSSSKQLKIPSDHNPYIITTSEDAHTLALKCGVLPVTKEAHNDLSLELFTLPIPSEEEEPLIKVINDQNSESIKQSVVFTTMALLLNVCQAHQHFGTNIFGCADGKFSLTKTKNYCLLCFGTLDFGWRVNRSLHTNSYRPFVNVFGPGERWEISLLGLVLLRHICKKLFDFEVVISYWASDHTNSFINAFKYFSPESTLVQCYPHIVRKFIFHIMKGRPTVGEYKKYCCQIDYLIQVAADDVGRMHLCQSMEMFHTMWKLVKAAWTEDGKFELVRVFEEQYILMKDFQLWYYKALPCITLYPSNNALESHNLETTGSSAITGILKGRLAIGNTIIDELPKYATETSKERCGVNRVLDLNDLNKLHRDDLTRLKVLQNNWSKNHVYDGNGGYFVNTELSVDELITPSRLALREDSRNGIFTGTHKERTEYLRSTASLCHVTVQTVNICDPPQKGYFGDCERCVKYGVCAHCIPFRFKQKELSQRMTKIKACAKISLNVTKAARLVSELRTVTLIAEPDVATKIKKKKQALTCGEDQNCAKKLKQKEKTLADLANDVVTAEESKRMGEETHIPRQQPFGLPHLHPTCLPHTYFWGSHTSMHSDSFIPSTTSMDEQLDKKDTTNETH